MIKAVNCDERKKNGPYGLFPGPLVLLWMVLAVTFLAGGCRTLPEKQAVRVGDNSLPLEWESPLQGRGAFARNLLDLVHGEGLRPLVDLALENNPNLMVTALSLKEVGVMNGKLAGSRLPQVDATLKAGRSHTGSGGGTGSYGLDLGISWEIDVWGRLADARSAGDRDEAALASDFQAARNSLSGNVIREWINYIALKKIAHMEKRRVESLDGNRLVILERYRMGMGTLRDLEAARSSAASAASALEARNLALKKSRGVIRTYLGTLEPEELSVPEELPRVETPVADIPGVTLGLRPDLKAAYARIQAADLRTRVAYKAMLPGFSFNPTLSLSGTTPSGMLRATPVWNLLGQLTAPLFKGGQLKADVEINALRAEKAYWNYKNTLVTAVVEVENALAAEKSFLIRQELLERAVIHAANNLRNYEENYKQGLTDILNLLAAQQAAFSLEVELLEVRRSLLNNRIDLGLALGLGA